LAKRDCKKFNPRDAKGEGSKTLLRAASERHPLASEEHASHSEEEKPDLEKQKEMQAWILQ
jgi:hypothetical protein